MNYSEPSNTSSISVINLNESNDNNIMGVGDDINGQKLRENCADNNIQQLASFNLSSFAFFIRPPCNETEEVKLAI